ncbi:MAG: response regulator [Haloglomus sp.]
MTPSDATVLVVDDEEPVREAYTLYLESADYDVRTARNGGEALTELSPAVDVMLLDRRMPGMSGEEVLEHVVEWHPGCRVAMVTAVDPDPDIVDMAFDDYLTKPVDRDELVGLVEQLLLLDRYETLMDEYHAAVRKRAVLSSYERRQGTGEDRLTELEARCQSVRSELASVVASFEDAAMKDVLEQVQPEPIE